MCAINPTHKKRFVIDVYTADQKMTKEEFDKLSYEELLCHEHNLNGWSKLRYHLKESEQQAD